MLDMQDKKRIVIKIGTSTLTHKTGRFNIRRVEKLIKVMADLQNSGKEIILVSSGAIGLGMAKLGMIERPQDTPLKQACAAVGQCELMYMYDKEFANYNITVAQVLLTKFIIENGSEFNVVNTMDRLIEKKVIPVVNENDTVAIDELLLEVGENDSLAAIVAKLCKADMLIILSDIDGLYDKDPHSNDDAKLISEVNGITEDIVSLAGGAGSSRGTGGMITKLNAAQIANDAGIDMVIMNGDTPANLYELFDCKKSVGTVFRSKMEG